MGVLRSACTGRRRLGKWQGRCTPAVALAQLALAQHLSAREGGRGVSWGCKPGLARNTHTAMAAMVFYRITYVILSVQICTTVKKHSQRGCAAQLVQRQQAQLSMCAKQELANDCRCRWWSYPTAQATEAQSLQPCPLATGSHWQWPLASCSHEAMAHCHICPLHMQAGYGRHDSMW